MRVESRAEGNNEATETQKRDAIAIAVDTGKRIDLIDMAAREDCMAVKGREDGVTMMEQADEVPIRTIVKGEAMVIARPILLVAESAPFCNHRHQKSYCEKSDLVVQIEDVAGAPWDRKWVRIWLHR